LNQAKTVIPEVYWAKTPLVLKATAGLRLLEPNQAKNLLDAVRNVFNKSGFLTTSDAVEIMEGTDEGIFSWFTLNFLLGRLNTRNTLSALDLGGGSTQVTFVPKDEVVRSPVYKDYVHTVATLSSSIDVFTTSYLNLGLMAVRHAVFTNNLPANQTQLSSECVNSIVRDRIWKYGTTEYTISGRENSKATAENPTVDYELCLQNVRSKVLPLVKPKPIGMDQHQISAFSYFFDRAIETGLIGKLRASFFFAKKR
jgi:ectonucleoside triphosphate diphosphohydrolase 5/6